MKRLKNGRLVVVAVFVILLITALWIIIFSDQVGERMAALVSFINSFSKVFLPLVVGVAGKSYRDKILDTRREKHEKDMEKN